MLDRINGKTERFHPAESHARHVLHEILLNRTDAPNPLVGPEFLGQVLERALERINHREEFGERRFCSEFPHFPTIALKTNLRILEIRLRASGELRELLHLFLELRNLGLKLRELLLTPL